MSLSAPKWAFHLIALLLAVPGPALAGEGGMSGTYVSEDGSTTIVFAPVESVDGAAPPAKTSPSLFRAAVTSPLSEDSDYVYERNGPLLTLTPDAPDNGGSPRGLSVIYRFTILDQDTLEERDTGLLFQRKAESPAP